MTTDRGRVGGRQPPERTIWDAVGTQALLTPVATAVHDNRDISYSELMAAAGQAAATIGAVAPPGSLVALDAAGHGTAVVAMLAAARAACAVLPMSASDPPLRRERIMADARPAAVLCESADGGLQVSAAAMAELPRSSGMQRAAYVIYTSGSTGQPKGVVVSHAALLRRLAGLAVMPGIKPGDSMMAMTALSFDIVMAEMLLPLTVGARVDVAPSAARVDPAVFARFAAERAPDIVQATPSFWRLALAWGWAGLPHGRIWCGGEPLTRSLAEQLARRCAQLWNLYGPTEATIWASAALLGPGCDVSLGTPLPGSGMYLESVPGLAALDDADRGQSGRSGEGEIIIYGAGLADGYLDAPDITRRRFAILGTPDGPRRCYRTGDRARRRPDGTFEFLGRLDHQVKLRGHRIELTEVEAAIEEHAQVREVVAVLQNAGDPERAAITAFVVTPPGCLTVRQLRSWLAERLPAAARPARIHLVDDLPHTSAGKIDRVRLAAASVRGRQVVLPPDADSRLARRGGTR